MPIELAGLLLFLAVMTGTPGPANLLLLGAAANHGPRAAAPFLLGVVAGFQLIVWPLGLGLLELAARAPLVYATLRWISAAYIVWLAWKIAGSRIGRARAPGAAPGFARGLLVHPLNPKAWAMVTGAYTQFVPPAADPVAATAALSVASLAIGSTLQAAWFLGGSGIARVLAGHPAEVHAMRLLAVLTVASVFWALR